MLSTDPKRFAARLACACMLPLMACPTQHTLASRPCTLESSVQPCRPSHLSVCPHQRGGVVQVEDSLGGSCLTTAQPAKELPPRERLVCG